MSIELTTASAQQKAEILATLEGFLIEQTWATPTIAEDFLAYAVVEVQLDGTVSGVGFSRSIDGVTFYPCSFIDSNFDVGSTTSSPGIYSFPGGCYLKQTSGSPATKTSYRAGN